MKHSTATSTSYWRVTWVINHRSEHKRFPTQPEAMAFFTRLCRLGVPDTARITEIKQKGDWSMSKHTKGLWELHEHPNDPWDIVAGDRILAGIFIDEDEDEANARLIAAAPDLLEAARAAYKTLFMVGADDSDAAKCLRAAIEKAEGVTA